VVLVGIASGDRERCRTWFILLRRHVAVGGVAAYFRYIYAREDNGRRLVHLLVGRRSRSRWAARSGCRASVAAYRACCSALTGPCGLLGD